MVTTEEQGPELSIVIPWRDRPEIKTTLRENRTAFDSAGVEVVVVNCGGDGAQLRQALAGSGLERLRCVEIEVPRFNKSLALNLGAFAAAAPRLFFLDADVVLKGDFPTEARRAVDGGCFVTVDRVFESARAGGAREGRVTELVHSITLAGPDNLRAQVETNRVRFDDGSRSAPGLVALAREHFLQVGGMNSDLEGWGWEDLDLLVRLQFVLRLRHGRAGAAVHLTHGDEARSFNAESRVANEQLNFAMCLENYRVGHFLGTYGDDVRVWGERLAAFRPD